MERMLAFPAVLFALALLGVAVVASWTDVTQRRIPNWLCAGNLVLGLSYAGLAHGGGWQAVGLSSVHVLAALAVTMVLFAVGAIGAGDAKFYASMAAWVPIGQGLYLLVSVALAGLVVLVVFFAVRPRGKAERAASERSSFNKLPYGVAIALGGLAAVGLS